MEPDKIVMMPIEDIQPYYNNPRKHDSISEVKESIRRVGFRGSIWVDRNNVIIAGHGRYMAAKELGMKEVPVSVMDDLTEAEVKYLRIKDNRASEQSDWDYEAYQTELAELRDMDYDVADLEYEVTGLDFRNLEGMMEDGMDAEHQEFLDKFKEKHTTDDCFTPPEVYAAVKSWVKDRFNHKGMIVRPFYPGGDYKAYDYPKGCLVLDNPPFSILKEIAKFYLDNDIDFFLFADARTIGWYFEICNAVLCGSNIIYENGADVNTSFITNLGMDRIIVSSKLHDMLEEAQPREAAELNAYAYPENVVTSMSLGRLARYGSEFTIKNLHFVKKLDDGTEIFGGGALISDVKAEKVKAEKVKIKVELSEREREGLFVRSISRMGLLSEG